MPRQRGDRPPVRSPDAAASRLSGAMNEAALWIARSPAKDLALIEATDTLDSLLEGLAGNPS